MAQTSDIISAIAARRMTITADQIRAAVTNERSLAVLTRDIRALAGSALRQDETKGLRGLVRRVVGR